MSSKWTRWVPLPLKNFIVRQRNAVRRQTSGITNYYNNARLELDARLRVRLSERRALNEARRVYENLYLAIDDPLITIAMVTYNRASILADITLPAVLAQTYENFEVVIVGDGCTDDTAERIAGINDPRIRFYNMPQRGPYPNDRRAIWMLGGVFAYHRALDQAHGTWIAHLDDDDVMASDHLEKMLRFAQQEKYELVYSQILKQTGPTTWRVLGAAPHTQFMGRRGFAVIPHSTVVFRTYLRLFRPDFDIWRFGYAADLHVWIRMIRAGVRIGFVPEVTVKAPLRPGTTMVDHMAEDRQ